MDTASPGLVGTLPILQNALSHLGSKGLSPALSGSATSASCQTQCALDEAEEHWGFSS